MHFTKVYQALWGKYLEPAIFHMYIDELIINAPYLFYIYKIENRILGQLLNDLSREIIVKNLE